MKRFIAIILTVLMTLGVSFEKPKIEQEYEVETKIVETEEVKALSYEDYSQLYTLRNDVRKSDNNIVELDQEDAWLLMQIAVHETDDYGVESQYLVMMVIINRLRSKEFPDSISEVIFQTTNANGKVYYQFLPKSQLDKVEPNADSHIALAMVEKGIDTSQGAIYYEASTNSNHSWHCKNREFLYEAYGQRYYK